jgi:hypothetical protein
MFGAGAPAAMLTSSRRRTLPTGAAGSGSFLVQLACSYGGELAAICDRIRVFENGLQMTAPDLA